MNRNESSPNNTKVHNKRLLDEDSPLLVRHFSMDEEENRLSLRRVVQSTTGAPRMAVLGGFLFFVLTALGYYSLNLLQNNNAHNNSIVVPIEHAHEHYVEVEEGIHLWYRTWGNRHSGIPVLFVHGGPGNAIEDYNNGNKEFFSPEHYFVIEVDQRGTGKSQPSVRDDAHNMQFYHDISVDQIAADYEVVREELGFNQWLVFGGSFGSTISLNYGTRYPERCLALIVRGIYLDTAEELQTVYSRSTYLKNPKRLAEFDILYNYAASTQKEFINPNDAKALTKVYEKLIQSGDRQAVWHWHVFENNLMEFLPENLLDPNVIDYTQLSKARSVAFFETKLWMTGSYRSPTNLLSRVNQLTTMPLWMCQGRRDEVCPAKYTRALADALDDEQAYFSLRFLDAGHEQTDPVMARCLKESLYEFRQEFRRR